MKWFVRVYSGKGTAYLRALQWKLTDLYVLCERVEDLFGYFNGF